jgi:hypothetical protein
LSGRTSAWLSGLAVAIVLAGCYGSTEPATDVNIDSATLNAHGTADKGRAHSYFQYWLTGTTDPERMFRTGDQDWPSGASGPFGKKATGLAAGSSYSFKVCGWDYVAENEGGPVVCAQVRTFTTKPPVEDSVVGKYGFGRSNHYEVDAHSSPSGAAPRGTLYEYDSGDLQFASFTGNVTCLVVKGSAAAVGAVGTFRDFNGTQRTQSRLWTVVDGRVGLDTFNSVGAEGSSAPNCATASFANQHTLNEPMSRTDFIVNDAQ